MKLKNLREKSISELNDDLLKSLREQLYLHLQKVKSGHTQQSHLLKKGRRNIARIKTILREKVGNNDQ